MQPVVDLVPCFQSYKKECVHPECRYHYHLELATKARNDWIRHYKRQQEVIKSYPAKEEKKDG